MNKQIHQVFINDSGELPDHMPELYNDCYNQIKTLYSDWSYKLYSGNMVEKIIKDNFEKEVYLSYKKLKPYSAKANLARYCLLYLFGGLYLDLTIYPLEKLYTDAEFYVFEDYQSIKSWSVHNGIMYSERKNPILKTAIDIVVDHCKHEYYGISPLHPTGCHVLGSAIQNYFYESLNIEIAGRMELMQDKNDNLQFGFFNYESFNPFALFKPMHNHENEIKTNNLESLGFKKTNDYRKMWYEKDYYDSTIIIDNNSYIFNYE